MADTRKAAKQGERKRESVEQRTETVITPKILPKLFEEMGEHVSDSVKCVESELAAYEERKEIGL